ncbi:MinD/ParA family protein [Kitasatospora sp. NPDC127059]|uniref:MinD/ParA family ATP-binding protein n=1 Tax=unclassified Kitasatospora TaxID=2633591 RepID=UPI00366091DF
MAADHMVIEQVRRLGRGPERELSPDYGLLPPAPRSEPDWRRPLDTLGTVLIPPEARPGSVSPAPVSPGPVSPGPAPVTAPAVLLAPPPMPPAPPAVAPAPPVPSTAPQPQPQAQPDPAPAPAPARRSRLLGAGLGGGLGLGRGEQREQERLRAVIRTPLHRSFRIAVIGLKGGVGKTSATLGLGSVLAETRADKVVAVDANPDTGTLSRRIRRETPATVQDLLAAAPSIAGYMDIRRFTSLTPSGLEVLANDADPTVANAFGGGDYRRLVDLLSRQYPIVLADCGTGLLHGSMHAVLDLADQLVVTATTSVDGASGADTTLDWLCANGYEELARRSVTLISGVRAKGRTIKADDLVAHFGQRCRAAVVLPFDEHLALGGMFEPARLHQRTRRAYLDLAALVAEGIRPAGA